MEMVPKSSSRNLAIPSSSILSIIAGSLIIIRGFLISLTLLGMSGHYGMKMFEFGTGGMTRGSCGIIRGGCGMMVMIALQPLTWWTATAVIPVISIVTGKILIIGGGYSIYKGPESEGK
jgi:hypothetical protein